MWIKTVIGMLLSILAVGAGGCLAVAVGAGAAGTVAYLAGDLEAEEPYSIDVVYSAARAALTDLDLHIVEGETTKDALSAALMARDARDKHIEVKLASTTVGTTEISIRVGVFGDETKSRLILREIRRNLEQP